MDIGSNNYIHLRLERSVFLKNFEKNFFFDILIPFKKTLTGNI